MTGFLSFFFKLSRSYLEPGRDIRLTGSDTSLCCKLMSYHSLGIVLLSRGYLSLLPGVYKLYDAQAARPSLIFFKMEEVPPKKRAHNFSLSASLAGCPVCAKRKREDDEAEKVHQLKLSMFSQERYWLNDSEEEDR